MQAIKGSIPACRSRPRAGNLHEPGHFRGVGWPGSDYPVADIDVQFAALQQVVPPADHERVLAHNALRLGASFGWWT